MRVNAANAAEEMPGHAGIELVESKLLLAPQNADSRFTGGAHNGTTAAAKGAVAAPGAHYAVGQV